LGAHDTRYQKHEENEVHGRQMRYHLPWVEIANSGKKREFFGNEARLRHQRVGAWGLRVLPKTDILLLITRCHSLVPIISARTEHGPHRARLDIASSNGEDLGG